MKRRPDWTATPSTNEEVRGRAARLLRELTSAVESLDEIQISARFRDGRAIRYSALFHMRRRPRLEDPA